MNRDTINPKYTRTYKTIAGLDKALARFGLDEFRHLLVYTADGRVTAVFFGEDPVRVQIAHCGFKVVG